MRLMTIFRNLIDQSSAIGSSTVNLIVEKPLHILALLILLALAVQVIRMAVWADDFPAWVGFGAYDDKDQGPRAKTLWDWMDLLIVPLTLLIGASLLNRWQGQRSQKIATDNQKQSMLESYFDRMTELLLNHELRTTENQEIRSIARTRTLVLFTGLDKSRKAQALQFLCESGLVGANPEVSLNGADLTDAELDGAVLDGVDLRGVNAARASLRDARLLGAQLQGIVLDNADLRGANLEGANLDSASLRGANLRGASLTGADFFGADLTHVSSFPKQFSQPRRLDYATMPDGQKYEAWKTNH